MPCDNRPRAPSPDSTKSTVTLEGKSGIPLIAEAKGSGGYEYTRDQSSTDTTVALELDPADINDIIRALQEANFSKFIVLEDFHYLPGAK